MTQPTQATEIQGKESAIKPLLRGLAYFVIQLLIVFTILEAGIRIFMPQVLHHDVPALWEPNEDFGWVRRPGQRLTANTGERDVLICTDEKGDRVRCEENQPRECQKRILVVGDSFVEALAIPFEETAWSILERKTGACLDVSGIGGYRPSQYLKTIESRLESAPEYDAIILSVYTNDFDPAALEIPPPKTVQSAGPTRIFPSGLSLRALRQWFYPYNQALESNSHAYVALRFLVRNLRDPGDVGIYGVPSVLLKSQISKETIQNLVVAYTELHKSLNQRGISLLISVLPFRNQVLDPSGEKLKTALPAIADDIHMGFIKELFIDPLSQVEGLVTVDLFPGLLEKAGVEHWGSQDRHLSPRGHALWAELLLPAVEKILAR